MAESVITIERHIVEQQRKFPEASGEFSGLLTSISFAAKIISREVNKAGLVDILGITGEKNVHGETVQKLDDFAQNVFVQVLSKSGYISILISEESENPVPHADGYPIGKYALCIDPLDGSSNIDVNVSIGSIFGIYRSRNRDKAKTEKDVLQPGKNLVGAGYVIYGSSTMLVYSTGQGVHGFTLDPGIGEFLLSHENIIIPPNGKIYSINEGYSNIWDESLVRFIRSLKQKGLEDKNYHSGRYIGSLVADFHRNLLMGGIFLYPANQRHSCGKLRLLYEAVPLAYIVEQAGGYASNGEMNILDVQPKSLHERTPLFIGSKEDVQKCENYLNNAK
ncbi:class 1 fructose-bisphosphatase [candidate division KSB1 bacterium]